MRSEFELTNQDSADGKDCTVMTSTVVGKNWNWVTFLSGDVKKEFVITKLLFLSSISALSNFILNFFLFCNFF